MLTKVSKGNHACLMQYDVRAYLLFQRISFELKQGWEKTPLEVITAELPKAVMYDLFHKNIIKSLLDTLEDMAYIKRVSNSQRNNLYYINPNVTNCLTGKQAEEYKANHMTLFEPLKDMELMQTPDQE